MIIAGNWKMFKTSSELRDFFSVAKSFSVPKGTRCLVAPSPTLLAASVQAAQGTCFEIFSQNCHWESSGAFTGEVSAPQILDAGARGTLVGHSERRQYFGETNETCHKRLSAARAQGLEVIFCIGEHLSERNAGKTEEVLEQQLRQAVSTHAQDSQVILAYEPVWAIGTGVTATAQQVQETHGWIRGYLDRHHCGWKILYGGSVKPTNFRELSSLPNVDGGLIGGASLDPESFRGLISAVS